MTIRKRIAQLLQGAELTANDLSRILGIREKEVIEHLPHVEKSLGTSKTLIAHPSECLSCGFIFNKRTRFTTPGRCPVCKSEQTTMPVFAVKDKRSRKGR